eukprot:4189872-Prymnesium_polylepis.1
MVGTACPDATAMGTTNQNEWDVIDRMHYQRMTDLGVIDQFVSLAMELASKKGVRARSKLRQHRREHNDREIRKALLANAGVQSTPQPHVRASMFLPHTSLCPPSRASCPQGPCGTPSTHGRPYGAREAGIAADESAARSHDSCSSHMHCVFSVTNEQESSAAADTD